MRNAIILFLLFSSMTVFAQKEGKIIYEEKTKIQIELPEDSPITKEQLEQMMPSERIDSFELLFNQNASIYKAILPKDAEDEVNQIGSEGDVVQIKMVRTLNENISYHDIKKDAIIQKQDFMNKTFLIKDKVEKRAWKMTGETKEIAGYMCQKAVTENEDKTIEAWFAPSLPVATGPSGYYQLPGTILGIHTKGENSERWLTAKRIQLEKLDKDVLTAPKKGKVVNREEYEKIVEEKTKEMEESMGGRGVFKIKVNE